MTGNVDYACDYIAKNFEGVSCAKPEGTYMLFIDCTEWCEKHGKEFAQFLKEIRPNGQIVYTFDNGTVSYIYEFTPL